MTSEYILYNELYLAIPHHGFNPSGPVLRWLGCEQGFDGLVELQDCVGDVNVLFYMS